MISYNYIITNKNGDTITLNDHATDEVYALQAYPKFVRNVKNTEIERSGQAGYWDFYSYLGKMTIAFSGVIVADTHANLEAMKAQMLKVFQLPLQPTATDDGYVTIQWTDETGIPKQVEAKIIQDIDFNRRLQRRSVLDFQVQVKTKDAYITGAGGYGATQYGIRGYAISGMELETLLPFSFSSNYENLMNITVSSYGGIPEITITGEDQFPIVNPTITNLSTGVTFKLNLIMPDENYSITINTDTGTVVSNTGQDLSGFIDIDSSFITLKSGLNQLLYTSDNDPNVTGILPESPDKLAVKYKSIYAS